MRAGYRSSVTKPSIEVVERHPHLAVPVADGYVRVDMHTHTMWSGDSTTTPDEFTASVTESGLEVVCITDHNDIAGAVELADRLECRVIVGEELRTPAGEIIGLFLTDRIPMGVGHIEAAMAIRDQAGVVYIPHPFDTMRRNLSEAALYELAEAELIDVVEVLNAKTSLASLNRRAAEFAAEFGIAAGAGSDAHVPAALGAAYVEMPDFSSAADFCSALRAGTVVGHHWDEPRPWSPRIVPSVNPS
jgi:predicted metal-dependent phosphoesterase TrpH